MDGGHMWSERGNLSRRPMTNESGSGRDRSPSPMTMTTGKGVDMWGRKWGADVEEFQKIWRMI